MSKKTVHSILLIVFVGIAAVAGNKLASKV
jgi:hypothetical protein